MKSSKCLVLVRLSPCRIEGLGYPLVKEDQKSMYIMGKKRTSSEDKITRTRSLNK